MTPDVILEKTKKEDIDRIIQLIRETMNDERADYAKKLFEERFASDKPCPESTSFVAKVAGKIVGISGLYRENGPNIGWVSWFAVDEKFQRKGVGTLMINNIIKIAKEEKRRKIFVETYTGDDWVKARNFYEKIGFTKQGFVKGYLKKDVDAVYYGKELD